MLTCFISKTHHFLKINGKIKWNPDAFSVFSTHIKYSSSKKFNSRTGNIMFLLFLWMPFSKGSHTGLRKNELLNTSAIKCSMNTHMLWEILKKNISVLMVQVLTTLNRWAAKNKTCVVGEGSLYFYPKAFMTWVKLRLEVDSSVKKKITVAI